MAHANVQSVISPIEAVSTCEGRDGRVSSGPPRLSRGSHRSSRFWRTPVFHVTKDIRS